MGAGRKQQKESHKRVSQIQGMVAQIEELTKIVKQLSQENKAGGAKGTRDLPDVEAPYGTFGAVAILV